MKSNTDVIMGAPAEPETVVCCDYDELAGMITRWLEEYQKIQPQIEALCTRGRRSDDLARDSVPFSRLPQ